jgi:hypothetical protein
MKRCDTCNGKFGLTRRRWMGHAFCSKVCLDNFLAKRARQAQSIKRWLQYLKAE